MKNALIISLFTLCLAACTSKPNAGTEFFVRGNCDMCKERIEKTALSLKGVSKAEWHAKNSCVIVSYDSTVIKPVEIEKGIAGIGHATKNIPMDSTAHDKLPECCKVDHGDMH